MKLQQLTHTLEKTVRANSPAIFTSIGVSGVLATTYFSAKASFKAGEHIRLENLVADNPLTKKEKVKLVWKHYIPTAISATLTIGSIITGARIGMKKTAAAYSVLAVTERAFDEYKTKVVEELGEKKEKAIRDEIAQDHVNENQPGAIVVGAGSVLCQEMHTGRYFNCDMETLRRAENRINSKLIREVEATLSDFYYMVGLPTTSYSSRTGWDCDKMMYLQFSTSITEDGRPCLVFDYNYVRPF